jgi:aspartate racemase
MRSTLGIIGGLGPLAGAYFLELLTVGTAARTDQEHIDAILYSSPSIPDRTAYIIGKSDLSPLPSLTKVALALEKMGVSNIAVPCVTSHYFFAELAEVVHVPILNMVKLTADYLRGRNIKRAGIAATDGTVRTGLFQKALEDVNIEWALPPTREQAMVMSLIYDEIKAGKPTGMVRFSRIAEIFAKLDCDCVILGCTGCRC